MSVPSGTATLYCKEKEVIKMKTTTDLSQFKGYDLSVAKCHIANFGKVFLDEYNMPMDVEDVINEGLAG